jgi:LPS export ABC transporter protein LptC
MATIGRTSLIALVLIAIVIGWQVSQTPGSERGRLILPENAPDLYIEQPVQTRFNTLGQPTMRASAEALSFYESSGESLMTQPIMVLMSNPDELWQITSEHAILYDDGSADFERDVAVIELNTPQGMQLYTDWLRVEQNGRFVTTPRPVRLIQPGQEATGVGMDAFLTGEDSELTLKSEVSIRYDAN